MKIAVVIPVYNVAPYLGRCIDSLLSQTHRDFELVLVDDGSTDGSGNLCDEFATGDPRVRVIHQSNGGLSAARNAALDLLADAKTLTHVTFVDSDDWVAPRYLEELALGLADGAEISSVRLFRTSEAGDFPSVAAGIVWRTVSSREFWSSEKNDPASACGKLYALHLFDGIRYPVGKVSEDELTTYRICFRASRIAYAEVPLYAYFTRPGSIMNDAWSPRRLDRLQAWRDQMLFFKEKGFPELAENSRRGLVVDLVDGIRNLRQLGDRELAERYRCELARQLKEGRLPFAENYLAYKTAHPLRTKLLKRLCLAKQLPTGR